jgi:hypothetical protein
MALALAALMFDFAAHRLLSQSAVSFDASGNMRLLSPGGQSPPAIVRGPSNRALIPGSSGSMAVLVAGTPPFSFQWFLNGSILSGPASDTILFTNISAADAGDYRVIVSNASGSVTSVVARLDIDADHDGLGDTWETNYFGSITKQNAGMDQDGDGIANFLEYGDGTNPTNRVLFLPRLAVYPVGGVVLLDPNREAYQSNDLVTLTAIPDPGLAFIGWAGDLDGSANPATLRLSANRLVQANFGLPLSLALNITNPVSTGGRGGWIGQTQVTHDGSAAAAVAPPLAGTGDPFIETTVQLARDGTASFWWRIDGEKDNALKILVDNDFSFYATRTLYGTSTWQLKTIFLAAGTHKLRWTYIRYGGGWTEKADASKPRDTAYVDQLTLTEYDNLLVDTDANGLPDLWEYRYFDGLGNKSIADPDGDGVSTSVELADGTDPNTKSSVLPRLSFTVEGQGSAAASPAAGVYAYGQYVTNTATAEPGWHFVAWVGPFDNDHFFARVNTNNPSRDRLYQSKTFKAIFGLPPGLAAGVPELSWRTGADLPWYGQSIVTHDGADAAQSAVNVDSYGSVKSESWLETTVTGPGTLSFFWKVSSATNSDFLTFLVNAAEVTDRLSGRVDWEPVLFELPEGLQTLRWSFQRNYGYDTNALNTAWLDGVHFTPGTTKPEFIDVPSALIGFATSNLTFSVAARGTPPLLYQVFRNGVALTQPSTNTVVSIPNAGLGLTGAWIVRAQNASGSVDSPPISVTLFPPAPNDLFSKASSLTGPTPVFAGYTFGAGKEANEPSHSSYSPHASVWHRWTAPSDGVIRVTATATNLPSNLILAAYQGATLQTLVTVAENDVYAEETNGVKTARVQIAWRAQAGTRYSVAVDTGQGAGVFYQLVFEAQQPPANDAFASRLPVQGLFVRVEGDNSTATAEAGEPPVYSLPPFYTVDASNTLWYAWTAPVSGRLSVTPLSDDITPLLSIFTGDTLATLQRLTNAMVGTMQVSVVKGITYSISADSEQGRAGHFTFLLTLEAPMLALVRPAFNDPGMLEINGPPNRAVVVQFSPNLEDWYFWSSNSVSSDGTLQISLEPPQYIDQTLVDEDVGAEIISIPSSRKRFFRVIAP